MSVVLGIDIASVCGWCVGASGERPHYGSVRLIGKGASDGSILAAMADWLNGQIAVHRPSLVAYEAPLGHHSSINQAKLSLRLSGVVELICWRKSVRVQDVHVKIVRSEVVGNGNCQKPDVADWVASMGWPVPMIAGDIDNDATDACAVWAYATGIRANRTIKKRAA